MGESGRTTAIDRDIEQAIVALKKGAHLLKYGRRGKPKFCPFRLSTDEKILIWFSGKEERQLKLSSITKILPGQRTVNFQRQPQPEKECQSFSLIYGNGEQSIDLICKDKEQAETWYIGLKALVSISQYPKLLRGGTNSYSSSPAGLARRKHGSGILEDTGIVSQKVHSLCGSPPRAVSEKGFSDGLSYSSDNLFLSERRKILDVQTITDTMPTHSPRLRSDYYIEKTRGNTQNKDFQINLSSAVNSDNHSSFSIDESDVLRDVLMWGEGIEGGTLGGGNDKFSSPFGMKCDALLPKLVDSTATLDVRKISCGGKHASLVTRQGEVFCWGEENGGRLGHRINFDVFQPKIVESLVNISIESIACGEYHTCALSDSGDLYMWGGGRGVGILVDGSNRSPWLPHRVMGPLDGIFISSVACGDWHTAVVSASGQLFTYGEGMFGALGHGNFETCLQPKEVESLKGLRVKSVSCGPWNTAAIVEIMVDRLKDNAPSGKLFTWGDNDGGRLGHTDKEKKPVPTCVSLVDHDFVQVSCGRTVTVALTVTGIVCTMGSSMYGLLGNPSTQDKSIGFVEGELHGEFVTEISSGSHHVAVLTSKGKVYTWGKGANGRLGLGDIEDRNSPVLVEALKNRKVESVACGSSFTAAICLHKSISCSDQLLCTGCKMLFGFTRKKHNCYNCGFVFCHACSSKKAINACLAPNKSKQYRVCDRCFSQLTKYLNFGQRLETPSSRHLLGVDKAFSNLKTDRPEETFMLRAPLFSPKFSGLEELKSGETLIKQGTNQQSLDLRSPLSSRLPRWGQVACPKQFNTCNKADSMMFVSPSNDESLAISPAFEHQSPPRLKSITRSNTVFESESTTETNKMLIEEVHRLRTEVRSLSKECQMKNEKIQQYREGIKETWSLAKEEVAKSKAAKEVIKALTARLNSMSEKLPAGKDASNINSVTPYNVDGHQSPTSSIFTESPKFEDTKPIDKNIHMNSHVRILQDRQINGPCTPALQSCDLLMGTYRKDQFTATPKSMCDSLATTTDTGQNEVKKSNSESGHPALSEWVEQDEPGVYITFMVLPSGLKGLKRMRFSRKKFSEEEARVWWEENRSRIYQKYNIEGIVSASSKT